MIKGGGYHHFAEVAKVRAQSDLLKLGSNAGEIRKIDESSIPVRF